jgi:hypothetical protein
LEKDSETLAMLVSIWDEGGGSPWQALLYGPQGVAGRPAHVAKVPPLCTKVVVVELKRMLVEKKVGKEGVGGRSAKPWPPLSLNFLHPPHLVPFVLKPLRKSIKSKAISLHSFPKFLLFIYF